MNQIQQEQHTGKGGITLPISENILIDEHEEGAFGVLKSNREFKRFLMQGKTNISTELFPLCIAFDLQKFFSKLQRRKRKSHLFPLKKE